MKLSKTVTNSSKDISQVMLHNLAQLLFAVFSIEYEEEFKKLLLGGGGGNSMFINTWMKPSAYFVKMRISSEAEQILKEKYTVSDLGDKVPWTFLKSNAKGAANRIKKGKHLHIDHNPGNVKVLELIYEKIQTLKREKGTKANKIEKLKSFLKNIQYLDIITVGQDDIRTLKDKDYTRKGKKYSKREKDRMTRKERDQLTPKEKFRSLPTDLALKIKKRFL